MTQANVHLRHATPEDVTALRKLIEKSVRGLQTLDYSPAQIEGALQTVFGVDSQLIADGTYVVAEAKPNLDALAASKSKATELIIVGCGGLSKGKTIDSSGHLTGRDDALLDH